MNANPNWSQKEHVKCPYCEKKAKLVTGEVVYPHRSDLAEKRFYHCAPCGAYVGCHDGTEKPLGRLANPKLRSLKMRCHDAFDPHWLSQKGKHGNVRDLRSQLYNRLAKQMGIPKDECHFGMFTEVQCEQALRLIAQWPTS